MKLVRECPVCGGRKLKPYAFGEARDGWLHVAQVRCAGCGAVVSQPMATADEINDFYRDDYYAAHEADIPERFETFRWHYERSEWPLLMKLLGADAPAPGSRFLEVGCGLGVFLSLARDAGFKTFGVDLSPTAVEWCRSQGMEAQAGGFPGADLPANSFDVVAAMQVIEHSPTPRDFVRELVRLARPGGWVVISTERIRNCENYYLRVAARLRGRTPAFQTASEHTVLIEPENARRLLEEAGCGDFRTVSYVHRPQRESYHWRLRKGLFRTLDRWLGLGPCHLSIARKKATPSPAGA
ncbi:MAG TPA: class I SAM-dependent methyltransferase [Planctomycetia bacterium]|nr:class I SAM-dependent methyltransferase [Planctomycetia bacterium]